ncbi:MAG TPA: RNA polymerase sigma factor [Candidatus Sulfopaludibacter sp.]|jgi:RNA polymerase sigma-70 factor (ECF subfamily)|nr:RNA polymerase sigma factor [Candidatus Sulfopaludibacter sp.]
MESGTEQSLLQKARSGDERALMRLFDEYHLPMFRFAWRLTGRPADAEDIVQECFLGLLRPSSAFDPRRSGLRTYLFGAVRNQAWKQIRRREASEAELPVMADHRSPEAESLRTEREEAVAKAIRQLPDTQQEVLILAQYEQMPLAEIAALLEIELGAVKSRLQRARAALKDALAEYAPAGKERQA